MRLDRNTNPDGKGKYALINLRTNQIQWGGEGGEQFFVMKYKDKFAAPALRAYAKAVRDESESGNVTLRQSESLREFADDMDREAEAAEDYGDKLPD
jgi:hypothetical protein